MSDNISTISLPSGPIGLSLSGGGSKGAYGVGVLKHLLTEGGLSPEQIRILHGTSTGALIAASIAAMKASKKAEHIHNMIRLYETVTNPDILRPNHDVAYKLGGMVGVVLASWAFGGNSIFSTKPLEKLVDKCITAEEWEAIAAAGDEFEVGFCVVNLQTAKSEIITNRNNPDPKVLREALLASANQPVFMSPRKIFKGKKHQYVDGGILDFNPIEKLFTSDYYDELEAVLAISMNTLNGTDAPSIGYDRTVHKDIGGVAVRAIKIMVESVFDTDIKTAQLYNTLLKMRDIMGDDGWQALVKEMPHYMRKFVTDHLENKKYVPIYHVAPHTHVPMDSLKFEQPAMRDLVERGRKEAESIFV